MAAIGILLLTVRHHGPRAEAAQNPGTQPRHNGLAPAGPASAPGAPGAPGKTGAGQITVTANAAQNASASSVEAFLDRYFNAINAHDYQAYVSLLGPRARQGLTAERFDRGYRSTADAAQTLVRIAAAADGDVVADVTFTSHQDPADSPDQTQKCTDWDVSLYLERDGVGYLIDQAPPGYHASYYACA